MARYESGGVFWFFLGMAVVVMLMVFSTVQAAEYESVFSRPASDAQLNELRGNGHPFQGADPFGDGRVVGNQVVFLGDGMSVTQQNQIANAYNGSRGIFTTVQNAGNNVLIQTATIVNITVH